MIFSQTKHRAILAGTITALMMLSFQICGTASAYDEPDFEYEIFSADGLFLEKNDRDSLLQALASLASNFPADKVDSDLKEKALALALRIAPLHQASRRAHSSLSNGKPPAPIEFFKKTTSIANTLWDVAEKMLAGKPEPEAEKLAPFLMDLSLTVSPTPPPDRLNRFARLRKFELLPWDQFVSLQPNTNSSSAKIGILFSLLKMEGTKPPKKNPNKNPAPKKANSTRPDSKREEMTLQLQSASMPAFGISDGTLVVGTLRLNMRKISGEQRARLNKRLNSGEKITAPIHLGAASSNRVRITGFPQIARLTRFRYKNWPSHSLAQFGFVVQEDISPPPPRTSLNISLPGIILMHSVYSGKTVAPSLIFAGEFVPAPDQARPDAFALNDRAALFENMENLKAPFLVLPDSAYQTMLEEAVEAGKLGNLFKPQLLSFSDINDAIKLAMDEPEELRAKAKAAFEEIEAVISQMSVEDLARNKAVRVRLQKIVDDYPRHISARIMLDFGKEKNG